MSIGVAIALLAGTQLTATLKPESEIELADRYLRVSDVATLSGADAKTRAAVAARTLARLPAGRDNADLLRSALANLLRRAVPAIEAAGGGEGTIRFRISAPARPAVADRECLVLAHPVARGMPLAMDDVRPSACETGKARAPIRFDRSGSLARAADDLPDGAYLGRLLLPLERGVDRGDRLTLRSVVGPVRVEREVVALQPGRPGRRVFVRDQDGETLAAPLSELRGEEDR